MVPAAGRLQWLLCYLSATLQAPSEVKGKPVDDIINEWNAELERRSRSFVKHAEALAQVRPVALGPQAAAASGSLPAGPAALADNHPTCLVAVGRGHPVQPARAAGAGGGASQGGQGPGEPGEEAAGGGRGGDATAGHWGALWWHADL